jgi:hypothetical protein
MKLKVWNYKYKFAENRKLLKQPKTLSSLVLSFCCIWICLPSLILPLQSQTNFACGWAKWLKEIGQPHTFLNNPANISQQLAKAKQ